MRPGGRGTTDCTCTLLGCSRPCPACAFPLDSGAGWRRTTWPSTCAPTRGGSGSRRGSRPRCGEWTMTDGCGPRPSTTARSRRAQIVIATGYSNSPVRPNWPGQEGFGGAVVHASEYRNARPFAGRDVLVVGAGNSGAEIAADLAEGGAATVRLAIRTPPNIIPRQLGPVPTDTAVDRDGVLPGMARRPRQPTAAARRPRRPDAVRHAPGNRGSRGAGACDGGHADDRCRSGRVSARGAGSCPSPRSRGSTAARSCSRTAPESRRMPSSPRPATRRVSCPSRATSGCWTSAGYPFVTGPRTLPTAPGLRFIGLSNPLKGQLFQIKLHARASARAVAKELRAS